MDKKKLIGLGLLSLSEMLYSNGAYGMDIPLIEEEDSQEELQTTPPRSLFSGAPRTEEERLRFREERSRAQYAIFAEAIRWGYTSRVQEIIDAHMDVNCHDALGWTPLHEAAAEGKRNIVELLVNNGANLNAEDKTNQTPLVSAVMNNHREVAEFLIRHHANAKYHDNTGWTPLHAAAARGMYDIVDNGANINVRSLRGTPLDLAIQNGHEDVAEFLRRQSAQ